MYCRNCGKSVESEAEICSACGFYTDTERYYCPKCGASTETEQALCLNCKTLLDANKAPDKHELKSEVPKYKKYITEFERINLGALISNIIYILAVLCVVFLPVFKIVLPTNSIPKQLTFLFYAGTQTEFGYEYSISFFSDAVITVINVIQNFAIGIDRGDMKGVIIGLAFFAIEIHFIITFISRAIRDIIKVLKGRNDIDEYSFWRHDEFGKIGMERNVCALVRLSSEILFVSVIVLSFIINRFIMPVILGDNIIVRLLSKVSGINWLIYVLISLIVVSVIVNAVFRYLTRRVFKAVILEQLGYTDTKEQE